MRISVFGVGYVGCVSAACLARAGHQVIGVDVDPFKVATINQGRSPFFEPGLNELLAETVAAGRLRATTDEKEAVRETDIALVCVGTPTEADGSICLTYLKQVFAAIGNELRKKKDRFVVALRSTVLPNAIEETLLPILEQSSGKVVGRDFGFAYNPEFLREGTALKDFQDPPWTIIGASQERDCDTVASLYQNVSAPVVRTNPQTAVLVKYVSNAYHALKVAFANEVSQFCRDLGVDSRKLMEIFCGDTKLNVSRRYLKPGFPFGGSCLPKDLKALTSLAARRGFQSPLLQSVLVSNELHLRNCIQMVADTKRRRIGLVGLAFKQGTDDLRDSPAVELAERLIGKGFDVRIFEPSFSRTKLHGSNLMFLEKSLPHVWKLKVNSLDELFAQSDVVVLTQQLAGEERAEFRKLRQEQLCIDLAGTLSREEVSCEYRGVDSRPAEALVTASAT